MNSNEALAAYWGASSNTNEHTDWDPNLNPITWLHCSGQVGCFYLQANFCRRAAVCRVTIMQSLWSYDSHWLKTAFLCGHAHLHSGYHLPYNNAALFHSSLSSSSLVQGLPGAEHSQKGRLIGHFLTASSGFLLISKEKWSSYSYLGDLALCIHTFHDISHSAQHVASNTRGAG